MIGPVIVGKDEKGLTFKFRLGTDRMWWTRRPRDLYLDRSELAPRVGHATRLVYYWAREPMHKHAMRCVGYLDNRRFFGVRIGCFRFGPWASIRLRAWAALTPRPRARPPATGMTLRTNWGPAR